MSKHTAAEVLAMSREFGDTVGHMLADYADLLAAQEKAEPVVWPNGMDAGDVSSWLKDRSLFLDPYIQGPMMQAIAVLIEDIPLFTHPPAQEKAEPVAITDDDGRAWAYNTINGLLEYLPLRPPSRDTRRSRT